MIWQDVVFLVGSMTSVAFLYPTLRDSAARVPRATSVPSMVIGGVYSATFFSLGMTFSAAGSFAACTMWSLIAALRGPDSESLSRDALASWITERRMKLTRQIRTLAGTGGRTHTESTDNTDMAPNSD